MKCHYEKSGKVTSISTDISFCPRKQNIWYHLVVNLRPTVPIVIFIQNRIGLFQDSEIHACHEVWNIIYSTRYIEGNCGSACQNFVIFVKVGHLLRRNINWIHVVGSLLKSCSCSASQNIPWILFNLRFIRVQHWSIFWAIWIHSLPSKFMYLRSVLIHSSQLLLPEVKLKWLRKRI
jgi:hypothetical protein